MCVYRFDRLQLPAPEDLPRGEDALASDFDAARALFNSALPHLREALGYYKLDGWVSEHVNIIMDISNLYRWGSGHLATPACGDVSAAITTCITNHGWPVMSDHVLCAQLSLDVLPTSVSITPGPSCCHVALAPAWPQII
jgi:hypothetical protein